MALERFPNTMEAFYNGHTFSAVAETTDFKITPIYDQAGRTVVYCIYAITIKETICPSDGAVAAEGKTASFVESAVETLSQPAAVFRYGGRGFGDLKINVGPTTDVIWGPKPKVIGLRPVGAGLAVELTWTVEVAIPNCDDAVFKFALMEFNYKLSFEKDRQGYTTRKYSGFIRIPQTRKTVNNRTLSDSADEYLDKIYPPVIPGFRRIPGSWTLSDDKCRGDFSITDEQMPPNAPPPGVIEAASDHTYNAVSLTQWTGTISATYDIERGKGTPGQAVNAFLLLCQHRRKIAENMVIGDGLPFPDAKKLTDFGKRVVLIPTTSEASEPNIYGRTQVKLSISYMIAGVGFTAIFQSGGLWSPLAGFGLAGGIWKTWADSMDKSLGARGHANLIFKPNEDQIVDLCGPTAPKGGGATFLTTRAGSAGGILQALNSALINAFPPPNPGNSWIQYRVMTTIHLDLGRMTGNTLPNSPLVASTSQHRGAWNVYGTPPSDGGQSPSSFPPLGAIATLDSSQSGGETFFQQRSKPSLYVTLTGQAMRAGYPIPMPELVAINGKTPTLVGNPYFSQGVVTNGNVPIIGATWRMTYLFTDDGGGAPTVSIPVPPSPLC